MKKRLLYLISILTVLSVLVAACQPAETTTPAPQATQPQATQPAATQPEATAPSTGDTGEIDCMGAQAGDEISMFYQWSGNEEERLNQILQPLIDACGIVIAPEASRDQALLDTRVQAGTPPDIAFFNVTQLEQYQDLLVPMSELGAHEESYPDFWREIGTVNGEWLGLPVKADPKTLIWYSPINFEAFGYEVPQTFEELDALVEQMVADGNVPWSMGLESGDATGWTGSDFIQDLMLVLEGPEFVEGLISGEIPYNDPAVKQAYEIYGKWATDPAYTVGGAQGTLETGFLNAIYLVFQDPPQAMMVKQSGFAGGEIASQFPGLEYGTDYDFFGVPDDRLQGRPAWRAGNDALPVVGHGGREPESHPAAAHRRLRHRSCAGVEP
jgi:alpha-glucoside transport system substrate-binding protein